jgi:hypothetical protein
VLHVAAALLADIGGEGLAGGGLGGFVRLRFVVFDGVEHLAGSGISRVGFRLFREISGLLYLVGEVFRICLVRRLRGFTVLVFFVFERAGLNRFGLIEHGGLGRRGKYHRVGFAFLGRLLYRNRGRRSVFGDLGNLTLDGLGNGDLGGFSLDASRTIAIFGERLTGKQEYFTILGGSGRLLTLLLGLLLASFDIGSVLRFREATAATSAATRSAPATIATFLLRSFSGRRRCGRLRRGLGDRGGFLSFRSWGGFDLRGRRRRLLPGRPDASRLGRGIDLLAFVFEEIGDVQKGVALEAEVDEGRLHPG